MEREIKYLVERFNGDIQIDELRKAQLIQKLCIYYNTDKSTEIEIEQKKISVFLINYELINKLINKIDYKIDWAPFQFFDNLDLKKIPTNLVPTININNNKISEIMNEIEILRKNIIELNIDYNKLSLFILNKAKENGDLN